MEIDGLQCDSDELVEIELDDETAKLLEQLAKERGVSIDQLVNEALQSALDAFDENMSGSKKL
jgi:predicted transcriptional regulator